MHRSSIRGHQRHRRGRTGVAAFAAIAAVAALSGCGGESTGTGNAGNSDAQVGLPSYYPDDYSKIIEASKNEGGKLVIYSNTAQENWAPIFRDFKKKYPWVSDVSANNLDSAAVFSRQLSEMATGSAPADMLVTSAAQAWAKYMNGDGTVMKYDSPEMQKLPEFAQLLPNVYAMSLDPVGMAYNSELVKTKPTGIASLAKIAAKNPDKFKNHITIRDPKGAYGFTVSHAWVDGNPDAWPTLEKVLPFTRPETSSGTQREKILSGEYLAGFFISSAVGYPAEKKSAGLLDFVLPDDGTIVVGRGIAITPKAPHPATAKLFLDFVLSLPGQKAVAEGGLSSYREGVELKEGVHTYQEVVDTVGEDHVIRVPYEEVPKNEVDAFVNKWYGYMGE